MHRLMSLLIMPLPNPLKGVWSAVLLWALSLPVQAASLAIDYHLSLIGLPLGAAHLKAEIDQEAYTINVEAGLSGLARLMTGGKGTASAKGLMQWERIKPLAYQVSSQSSNDARLVRMVLNKGAVSSIEIIPPIDKKPDHVPVRDEHKQNITDPVSALIMPLKAQYGEQDKEQCNRVLKIFDGAARFDISLTYLRTEPFKMKGYEGPVLTCAARYIPVSGHRALRKSTRFMENNRELFVSLVPVMEAKVLMPVKISVKTMIGTSVMKAENWIYQPSTFKTEASGAKPSP
jgi:hypothetical protein